MITLVTNKFFMRSKVKNNAFWTFDLVNIFVDTTLLMKLKVANNAFCYFWSHDCSFDLLIKIDLLIEITFVLMFQSHQIWQILTWSLKKKDLDGCTLPICFIEKKRGICKFCYFLIANTDQVTNQSKIKQAKSYIPSFLFGLEQAKSFIPSFASKFL